MQNVRSQTFSPALSTFNLKQQRGASLPKEIGRTMSSIKKAGKKEFCPVLGCNVYISGPGALRLLRLHWEAAHMRQKTCPALKGRLIHPFALAKRSCGKCSECTANKKESVRRRIHRRCIGNKKCAGCAESVSCLTCLHCIDKKINGGEGMIRKRCIWRMCLVRINKREVKLREKAMRVYNKS